MPGVQPTAAALSPIAPRTLHDPKGNARDATSGALRSAAIFLMCTLAALEAPAQEGYRVADVAFRGNASISSGDLEDLIELQAVGWFSRTIRGDDPVTFTEDALERDIATLLQFYQREGFLRARWLSPVLEVDRDSRTVDVTLTVEEGEAVLVDSVRRTIDAPGDPVPDSLWDHIVPTLSLQGGARFRDDDAIADKARVGKEFTTHGYAYAMVSRELSVDTLRNRVSVLWIIHPGRPVRFGKVAYAGNERTPGDVMDRRLAFAGGDAYDSEKLTESQKDLYRLGMFNVVKLLPDLQNANTDSVDVGVAVKEAREFVAKFGVGYGKEDKFRAFVNFTKLGFIGGARTADIFAKTSALEPYNISLTVIQPDLLLRLTRLLVNPYLLRQEEPAYTASRLGANLTLDRSFGYNNDLGLTYTYEYVDQDSLTSVDGEALAGQPSTYTKSAITAWVRRDDAVPVFDPASGGYATISATYSGFGLESAYSFARVILEARRYWGTPDGTVVAARVKIGSIWSQEPDGFVPLEERFYAGGEYSVRGYPRSSLGPKDESGTPTGGKSLLEGGVELRFPIVGVVHGGLFSDAGSVWDPSTTYRLSELSYSVGAGVRIETPVGPLRLDVAYPLSGDVSSVQYYLTIGHMF